jgi:hypothetical protein
VGNGLPSGRRRRRRGSGRECIAALRGRERGVVGQGLGHETSSGERTKLRWGAVSEQEQRRAHAKAQGRKGRRRNEERGVQRIELRRCRRGTSRLERPPGWKRGFWFLTLFPTPHAKREACAGGVCQSKIRKGLTQRRKGANNEDAKKRRHAEKRSLAVQWGQH